MRPMPGHYRKPRPRPPTPTPMTSIPQKRANPARRLQSFGRLASNRLDRCAFGEGHADRFFDQVIGRPGRKAANAAIDRVAREDGLTWFANPAPNRETFGVDEFAYPLFVQCLKCRG